ncbi:MAG: type II secretion system F family protein [Sphingomicrobium sp.]
MLLTIILVIGLGGTLLLMLLAFRGTSPHKSVKRRLELLKERHAEGALVANANAQIRKLMAARESRVESMASSLIPRPALLRKRLEQTGKQINLGKYALISVGLWLFISATVILKGLPWYLAAIVGAFVALGVPHWVIGRMIKKRLNKFNVNFPDAIELMVRGLRSGLPITETLGIVASEIGGPVGIEFRSVSDKMKIGRTMEVALQETADRLGTAEFQFFVITLAIQRETGGNLAETLSNLADVLRKRAQMKLKIRAMSSESKASAIIVGALPFIVFGLVYFMNPAYMGKFFIDQRLIVAGLGGMCWMGCGVFIMAKMVNFEI